LREEQKQKEAEEKDAQDNDVLDIGVNKDMFAGEKEETSGNRNNNNAKTTTKNQPAKKQPTKKEAKSPDMDRRRTYSFFPTPGKRKANTATEENHSRQINVHGLSSEFTECQAGGVQDNALYDLFWRLRKEKIGRHGIDIKPHHIVGARPANKTSQTSSEDEAQPMRVTVDSSETKKRIIDAAMYTYLQILNLNNGTTGFEETPEDGIPAFRRRNTQRMR
jgi:hypothetical protein